MAGGTVGKDGGFRTEPSVRINLSRYEAISLFSASTLKLVADPASFSNTARRSPWWLWSSRLGA